MRKTFLSLLITLCVGVLYAQDTGQTGVYECGSWLQLSATPFTDFHFVKWSDGNTDSIRQIQVNEDAVYIAYFASNCVDLINLPVVALYDWLLMLNVKAINDAGYYISPTNVNWYKVVGNPDNVRENFPVDDQWVGLGFYYTIAQNLRGTGNYYAVVDMFSTEQGLICNEIMQSDIIQYAMTNNEPSQIRLTPSLARPRQTLTLIGLNPHEKSDIYIYSADGKLVAIHHSTDQETYQFAAEFVAGCYQVHVVSQSCNQVLRYLVYN